MYMSLCVCSLASKAILEFKKIDRMRKYLMHYSFALLFEFHYRDLFPLPILHNTHIYGICVYYYKHADTFSHMI